jgi:hypothetical protein
MCNVSMWLTCCKHVCAVVSGAQDVLHCQRVQCCGHPLSQRILLGLCRKTGDIACHHVLSGWQASDVLHAHSEQHAVLLYNLCRQIPNACKKADCIHVLQSDIAIDNLLKHGINNLFILLDVLFSRVPFVSYHYQARTRTLLMTCLVMAIYCFGAFKQWVYSYTRNTLCPCTSPFGLCQPAKHVVLP